MKKNLLFLCALIMSAYFSVSFASDPYTPDLLSQPFDSFNPAGSDGSQPGAGAPTYDEATKTITFSQAWTNIGWAFWGNEDALAAQNLTATIEFDPAPFYMELVMSDYRGTAGTLETVPINAGDTKATVDIQPATNIVINSSDVGTLTLKKAYLTPKNDARHYFPLSTLGSAGWSTTNDGKGSITFSGAWTGCGWWLSPPKDFSAYNKFVANFVDPLPCKVQIVVEYGAPLPADPTKYVSSTFDIAVGATTGEVDLDPANASQVRQIYFMSEDDCTAGDVAAVKEAYFTSEVAAVVPSSVLDFESDAVGTAYPVISYGSGDITAVVEADPAGGGGQSLHVKTTNWNLGVKFSVTLPEGKTLTDLQKITFDFYLPSVANTPGGQTPNSYKGFNYFFGASGTSFSPGSPTGNTGNIIANATDNPGQTWLPKEFVPTLGDDLSQLNQFDFGLGLQIDAVDYYFDNIAFVLNDGTSIKAVPVVTSNAFGVQGGIVVNAANEKVSVYAIDGRLVSQTVVNGANTQISLTQGVYVVKVGAANPVKVVVR